MKLKKLKAAAALALSCMIILCSCSGNKTSDSSEKNSSKTEEVTVSVQDTSETETSSDTEASSQTDSSDTDSSSKEDTSGEEEKQPSDITPAMWKVTDKNGTSMTLLGSMHALKEEDYPLPDKIMNAYNSADILAVECDATSLDLTSQLALIKEMKMENGKTIKDVLSEDGYKGLTNAAELLGVPDATFDGFKPWAASTTLDGYLLTAAELSSTKGLDAPYLITKAKEDGKELYEVETVEFQMNVLMNTSDMVCDIQFAALKDAKSKADLVDSTKKLYTAWRTGDFDTLTKLAVGDGSETNTSDTNYTDEQIKAMTEYNNAMLYDRNKGMEKAIKKLLSEKKNVFFVVGAAHYAGEGGIIDLLEKDGYTVERIEY